MLTDKKAEKCCRISKILNCSRTIFEWIFTQRIYLYEQVPERACLLCGISMAQAKLRAVAGCPFAVHTTANGDQVEILGR